MNLLTFNLVLKETKCLVLLVYIEFKMKQFAKKYNEFEKYNIALIRKNLS